ncbi:MAG: isopenicillin N synthase family oxygenase [Rhodospirillaceae bacterium]|jgi:isopenicillin N synthase-like dioxygenase|nr:isopenicillin N synthase family oxygenase [Rhodospirillaceae bacterium]MBT6404518.1 isopenicillin N synthase family oxygenase [Rhodospirillaceae bacterium]MBT6537569.1 isopenicillin N synthase family oxygenase [Rhodospirillaceae bacterium]MBT7361202.1 isopenicillin N synthase family oxygenase [Rhodospirillaceae bacterium]
MTARSATTITKPATPGLVSHAHFNEIPIIDIGPLLANAQGALESVAAQIHHASTEVGFYFITNHGVSQEIVDRSFDASRKFHGMPAADKAKVQMNEHQCGWQGANLAVHGDSFENAVKAYTSEGFKFTFDLTPDDPDYAMNKRFRGHNQWLGTAPEDVQPNLMAFLVEFEGLAQKLLHPLAVSLDLEPGFFDQAFHRSSSMMRVAYYPVMPPEKDQLGLPGHTDLSFMSMIPPATDPGLQILTRTGEWIDQPAIPDAILVNTGDTLRHWSNDTYIATPHRVLPSKKVDRYSNILFFYPNVDAKMTCLPTCTSDANPPKYPPITFGEFHAAYAARNFSYAETKAS